MTTDELLTTDDILDAFATAGNVLPRAALKQAADRWPEVGPVLLAMLQAAAEGAERSDRTDNILVFGIYLMGQLHETRAFKPLCAVATDRELIEALLSDAVTTDLALILARVYDGDQAPLRMLIESENADEFARGAGLDALAWLTATGRIDRHETAHYLRDLYTSLHPQDTSWVWCAWQQAIARLGLKDLAPLVETAFERSLIDPSIMSLHHFQGDLDAALKAADPTEVFHETERDNGRLDDIAALLSGWFCFQPREEPKPVTLGPPTGRVINTTVHNPYRGVGRNDPCPCGSGKKFKKCCLDKVR